MPKTAFVFPGQGAQAIGMSRDFHDQVPGAKSLFQRADRVLNMPLSKYCFEGPKETLDRTDVCQPALLVASLAALEFFKTRIDVSTLEIAACGGLSLGEYTALVFAEALTFEDALKLVRHRGQYMQEACDAAPSGMTSILGLDRTKVQEACASAGHAGVVGIANINCPGQIVISGARQVLELAANKCKELGAKRTIPLAVAGAYHSALMKPAQDKLQKDLASVTIRRPKYPVAANVSGRPLTNPEEIRKALSTQVVSSVLWEDCVHSMIQAGVTRFYEFGPGRVLTGLGRKIESTLEYLAVDKIEEAA